MNPLKVLALATFAATAAVATADAQPRRNIQAVLRPTAIGPDTVGKTIESAYFTTGSGTTVPLGIAAALGTGSRVAPSATGTAFSGTAAYPDGYGQDTVIVSVAKERPTPKAYPRRPGIPHQTPL